MHYCKDRNGREYWVEGDEGREMLDGVESAKYWREDHHPVMCAVNGGDCVGVASEWKPVKIARDGFVVRSFFIDESDIAEKTANDLRCRDRDLYAEWNARRLYRGLAALEIPKISVFV